VSTDTEQGGVATEVGQDVARNEVLQGVMADVAPKGESRGVRKERIGVVVSCSGDKFVTVDISRHYPHPMYGKVIRSSRKYHAHDEENAARVGDKVRIVETRPMSRLKRWRVAEVLRAEQPAQKA
jgi:small subunit ribosomal protein S17